MLTISDDNVIVTGGAGGLGMGIAKAFSNLGANVISIDRKEHKSPKPSYKHLIGDLCDPNEIVKTVSDIRGLFSHVDLLVNCAGVFIPDDHDGLDQDILSALWRNNATSTVLFTTEMESLLQAAQYPSVVNIGSTDGVVASGGQGCEIGVSHDVFYALTKGAVVSFTRALAMKWANSGIRVNCVCPTVFHSPMTKSLLTEKKQEELREHIPMGRLGTIDDVVTAVFCAHGMRFTTGHVFPVDGGYLCQ